MYIYIFIYVYLILKCQVRHWAQHSNVKVSRRREDVSRHAQLSPHYIIQQVNSNRLQGSIKKNIENKYLVSQRLYLESVSFLGSDFVEICIW